MQPIAAGTPAEWDVAALTTAPGWVFTLDDMARRDLVAAVRKADAPELLEIAHAGIDLGAAASPIADALKEVRDGRGMALVRGLPRADLSEDEFRLLTWLIGLTAGVARPQGKASHYISAVRDIGTTYRSTTGRGYSSSAELDFHTDGADVVVLTCYNPAKSGGRSMVSSSVTAHNLLAAERPDLLEVLHGTYHFSRQAEQAPDEQPFYPHPIFDVSDGRLFSRWNRNRVQSAQKIDGVPPLSPRQREAMDVLDAVLRRPEVMYAMDLQPGDMQILNSHVTLHSRTEFEDHEAPERKRLLFRLWLAPPDNMALPESWRPGYRSVAPRTVRGGIRGQAQDALRRAFELRQAASLGMSPGP